MSRRLALSFALLATTIALVSPIPTSAQPEFHYEAELLADLEPRPLAESGNPERFEGNGRFGFFFGPRTQGGGHWVWSTDGTAAGTRPWPEPCAGGCYAPRWVGSGLGRRFLKASDSQRQPQLFAAMGRPESVRLLLTGADPSLTFVELTSRGRVLFTATRDRVLELWSTDGSPEGTVRLHSFTAPNSRTSNRVVFRGELFFLVYDSQNGYSVWRSDGTLPGTRQVIDAHPRDQTTFLQPLGEVAGRLLLLRAGAGVRTELWTSDGTARNTRFAMNLEAGGWSFGLRRVAANRLFWVASHPREGEELWVSDGTPGGTRQLTRLRNPEAFANSSGSGVDLFAFSLGGRFLVPADDGVHGREWWVSDGTSRGTQLLSDTCPGECSGALSPFLFVDGSQGWFSGFSPEFGDEPWLTDGTPAGTRRVRDLCRGECSGGGFPVGRIAAGMLLVASDPRRTQQFWVSDGTSAGTRRLDPSATGYATGDLAVVANGERAVFRGLSTTAGVELWATDGTAAGTGLLVDLVPGDRGGSTPASYVSLGDRALFVAQEDSVGYAVWQSDGTAAGTILLTDPLPAEGSTGSPFGMEDAAVLGPRTLLVLTGSADAAGLWSIDSPGAVPERLVTGQAGKLHAYNGAVYFERFGPTGPEFYRTDGTAAGTRALSTTGLSTPRLLRVTLGEAFAVDRGQLYVSPATTLTSWVPLLPENHSLVGGLGELQGRVYAFVTDGHEISLWSTDGTLAGTRREPPLPEVLAEANVHEAVFLPFGERLLVHFRGGAQSLELWALAGSPAQVERLAGYLNGSGRLLVESEGRVFFFRGVEGCGVALGITDGTAVGTTSVCATTGEERGFAIDLAPIPGGVAFAVLNTAFERDGLWVTDGTPAGTQRVLEGTSSSGLAAVPGGVIFTHRDPATGYEPWVLRALPTP